MDKRITHEESLQIINEMISEARNSFSADNAKSIIFMGYTVIIVAILNIALLYTLSNPANSYFVWFLMAPASLLNHLYIRKSSSEVATHISKVISAIWAAYSISIIILLSTLFAIIIILKDWKLTAYIMPTILCLTALGQYITSIACKFKPYKTGAVFFWLGALSCVAFLFTPYYAVMQFIILIICMLLGFIAPSMQLKKTLK